MQARPSPQAGFDFVLELAMEKEAGEVSDGEEDAPPPEFQAFLRTAVFNARTPLVSDFDAAVEASKKAVPVQATRASERSSAVKAAATARAAEEAAAVAKVKAARAAKTITARAARAAKAATAAKAAPAAKVAKPHRKAAPAEERWWTDAKRKVLDAGVAAYPHKHSGKKYVHCTAWAALNRAVLRGLFPELRPHVSSVESKALRRQYLCVSHREVNVNPGRDPRRRRARD